MSEVQDHSVVVTRALLGMTVVTGLIDAVSFLSLGHVFTANMTGNVVLLGFAVAGVPEVSIARSLSALLAFLVGAAIGGRILARSISGSALGRARAIFAIEGVCLAAATVAAIGYRAGSPETRQVYAIIALTSVAMGMRNASVRKLAIPDLTTTVLTLTITGLAADSSLAGGSNPRWQRRIAAVLALFAGAALGAIFVERSVFLALLVTALVTCLCSVALLLAFRATPPAMAPASRS